MSRTAVQATEEEAAVPKTRKPKTTVPLLPPENAIEVLPEGSSGETLNQKRLKAHYELEAQYIELRRRYYLSLAAIRDLIQHGATIQRGTYKPQYGVHMRRHPRYKQVVIDLKGEAYQQRILNNTAPHAYFRVRIS